MLANGDALYKFLDTIFSPHGFVRKKDTWYLYAEECICFFHISKSPFGGYYEEVMGCFYKKIYPGNDKFPKYYKNNLKQSLRHFTDVGLVKKVLNMEDNSFKGEEREELLRSFMEVYVIPFLKLISTEEGIKKAARENKDLKYYIDIKTRQALSIED